LVNPLREGIAERRAPQPCTLVLFGASGDLTERKLVPALYSLARDGLLPEKLAIVGFARRPMTDDQFRAKMLEGVRRHARNFSEADDLWKHFASTLFYHASGFEDAEGYRALASRLERLDRELGLPGNRLHYLATSPEYFSKLVDRLGEAGLTGGGGERVSPWARVVVEKPIGHDLASSRALNSSILRVLREDQVYRIDHYLGKETVQNILALRFSNGIFEPLWNHKYVEHVQITVGEEIGVGSRGGYYDGSGAIRDMVQNHLLQLLCLVAMEPPVAFEADAIRDEKVKVLRAVRRIPPAKVAEYTVRGQYTAGVVGGQKVPGYIEEEGVAADSATETYVAVRLEIDNWRWSGVPFLLRSGKRLPKRASEIYVQFRKPPMRLFGDETAGTVAPNAMIVNVQPDEGISLRFGSKVPGPAMRVRQVKMDFRYGSAFGAASPEAYERLLLDVMSGDSTLFTRRDEVEAAWTLIDDVREGWRQSGERPMPYFAGSWGPAEAERLFRGQEGSWRKL
jgi:glucose-6-phosphate 1-dehydrogenase